MAVKPTPPLPFVKIPLRLRFIAAGLLFEINFMQSDIPGRGAVRCYKAGSIAPDDAWHQKPLCIGEGKLLRILQFARGAQ